MACLGLIIARAILKGFGVVSLAAKSSAGRLAAEALNHL
jgi:hypothetical protein